MNHNNRLSAGWQYLRGIDWKLLVFLVLFLNVKLLVKIAALVIVFALTRNFRFGFRLHSSRLPLFYLFVMAIGFFNWLIAGNWLDINRGLVTAGGLLFWLLCILAIHQVKLAVERNNIETLHRTLLVFFLINASVSLGVYLGIIIETGHINPYRYQGDFQKYFIGTGDYIKGISFDTSTTNAVISAAGVIYFLYNRINSMVLLCMLVLLLTGSNITNLLLCLTLLFGFIFQTNRDQKSIMVVCLLMLVVFLVRVSPQNSDYFSNAWKRLLNQNYKPNFAPKKYIRITERPDSTLTDDEKKEKTAQLYLDSLSRVLLAAAPQPVAITNNRVTPEKVIEKPVIPGDSIHTPRFQHRNDTTAAEKQLIEFISSQSSEMPVSARHQTGSRLPGKLLAFRQTWQYLQHQPARILTGAGIGNFSSKLAFKATAMNIAGGYPQQYRYINEDFKTNHLDLFLYYFTNKDDYHSIVNSPNSVYDQLLGEYGIAGIAALLGGYLFFFFRRIRPSGYGLSLLLLLAGILAVDYWFEQLSVLVIFEFFFFLNNKEKLTMPAHADS